MNENKNGKRSLFIFLFIIAIAIVLVIIYMLYNEKNSEVDKVSDLNNKVARLENTTDILQENVDSSSNNSNVNNTENRNEIYNDSSDEVEYLELNESNFNKYNNENYLVDIFSISKNNMEVSTITCKVFEIVELPTISKNDFEILKQGKSIDILGYELIKDDEEIDFGGHDLVIKSENEDTWIKFYVDQNSDGTASLFYYSEFVLGKPTQIYLKTNVNNNVLGENTLEYSSYENESMEYVLLTLNQYNVEFEDNKLSCFEWSGV